MLFFNKNTAEEELEEEIEDILPEQDLFIHPSWVNMPQEMRYVYQYEHFELPVMGKGSFGINGISINEVDDKYFVTTFIRNTTDKDYCLDDILIYLVNDKKESLAVMKVNLKKEVGNIPSNSNMPWIFIFDETTRTELELDKNNWNIVFKVPDPHKLELDNTQDEFSTELKKQIDEAYKKLSTIQENTINFSGITCDINEECFVTVTTFIRNGYFRDIKLSDIILEVIDANESMICRAQLTLEDLEIPANSSKPWTFVFEPLYIMNPTPDLSTWRIQVGTSKRKNTTLSI